MERYYRIARKGTTTAKAVVEIEENQLLNILYNEALDRAYASKKSELSQADEEEANVIIEEACEEIYYDLVKEAKVSVVDGYIAGGVTIGDYDYYMLDDELGLVPGIDIKRGN